MKLLENLKLCTAEGKRLVATRQTYDAKLAKTGGAVRSRFDELKAGIVTMLPRRLFLKKSYPEAVKQIARLQEICDRGIEGK